MTMAPDKTREMRPRVRAFQVFRAMRASAKGTRTEALNLRPSRKGRITFLMKPCSENQRKLESKFYMYYTKKLILLLTALDPQRLRELDLLLPALNDFSLIFSI